MWNLFARVFGWAGLIAVLIWGWNHYWPKPELWNPTAKRYVNKITQLTTEIAGWKVIVERKDSIIARKDSVIAVQDTLISTQKQEWEKAIAYGTQWQTRYMQKVVVQDSLTDKLTDSQALAEYYQRMLGNGTLSPVNLGSLNLLSPSDPRVVKAGLKTANRAADLSETAKDQALAIGLLKARTDRMRSALVVADSGFSAIITQAKQNLKGGIPIIRHRRRQEAKATLAKAKASKQTVEQASELEEALNKP